MGAPLHVARGEEAHRTAVPHSERKGESGLRETWTAAGQRLRELDSRPRSAVAPGRAFAASAHRLGLWPWGSEERCCQAKQFLLTGSPAHSGAIGFLGGR